MKRVARIQRARVSFNTHTHKKTTTNTESTGAQSGLKYPKQLMWMVVLGGLKATGLLVPESEESLEHHNDVTRAS